MKKLLCLALAVLMLFTLAACAENNNETLTPDTPATTTPPETTQAPAPAETPSAAPGAPEDGSPGKPAETGGEDESFLVLDDEG